MTNGNRETSSSMQIMQLAVPGVNAKPLPRSKGEMTRRILFWCPNMVKQPIHDTFLGLNTHRFFVAFLKFLLRTEFKNSKQDWVLYTV